MIRKYLNIIVLLLLLQICSACSSYNTRLPAYDYVGSSLTRKFALSETDLIINYDLADIDNSDCLYSQDLGLILNNTQHQKKYLSRFAKKYKAPEQLKSNAYKKIIKSSNLLQKLDNKYNILSSSQKFYVKNLVYADVSKLNFKKELARLDKILEFIPVMLPQYRSMISSHYGHRNHPIKGRANFHRGMDMYAIHAGPIFASASGEVVFRGEISGYGKVIDIEHQLRKKKTSIRTRYAHLKDYSVYKGQKVQRGQIIGHQGKSGKVTREHLHFEIWVKNKHVNPFDFISIDCNCFKKG